MSPPLEFWFDFASTYSYVAAMRVEQEAARVGARVVWRPFLLGPLFHAQQGLQDSPFNVNPVRGAYMWRDLERLCAKHGLPWRRPSVFPRSSVLPARVALAVRDERWLPDLVRAVFQANFARDLDIGSRDVLAQLLTELGQPADAVLARAESPEHRPLLRAATEEATRRGLFGAPSFLVGHELFFGQDRMADALAWWAGIHPAVPTSAR